MSIATLVSSFGPSFTRRAPAFAAARARVAELAPFADARALARAFREDGIDVDARRAIVVALVREAQRAPDPLWQALLVAAFEPMLRGIRRAWGGEDDDDLDQRVLLAFLAALASLRIDEVGTYAPVALYWKTQHAVTSKVRADRAAARREIADEDGSFSSVISPTLGPLAIVSFAEVIRVVREEGGEALLEALVATSAGGESLQEYVDRVATTLDARERSALCKRLLRLRNAAIARVRERLAA